MHEGVGVIVYAENREEAHDKIQKIFEGLIDEREGFDYFDPNFKVVRALSKEGKKIISDLLESQREEHEYGLEKIRAGLSTYSNAEFHDEARREGFENDTGMIRHYMHNVGAYHGPSIRLYDQDGEGIRGNRHLNNVLTKWETLHDSNPEYPGKYEDQEIWVAWTDFHY